MCMCVCVFRAYVWILCVRSQILSGCAHSYSYGCGEGSFAFKSRAAFTIAASLLQLNFLQHKIKVLCCAEEGELLADTQTCQPQFLAGEILKH